ncbi:MAG TPA: DUF5777 family beta-barrel protein [Planctomycetota bacterium]|nr:DUF5777 family beta-barrel protein [Planctomycetota bacterium]
MINAGKILLALGLLILLSRSAPAFEFDMLNLKVPSQQDDKTTVLSINHRFYGKLEDDPIAGADVHLGMKYVVRPRIELEGSYTSFQNEYNLGAGYQFLKTFPVQGEISAGYFDYKDAGLPNRSDGVFYLLSLKTEPVFDAIVPVANLGYDDYNKRSGLGLGLSAGFNADIGPVKNINLIGEYYPLGNAEPGITRDKRAFALGIEFGTAGHTFALLAGNSTEIGVRRLMLGAPDNKLHFGFNINRKF